MTTILIRVASEDLPPTFLGLDPCPGEVGLAKLGMLGLGNAGQRDPKILTVLTVVV